MLSHALCWFTPVGGEQLYFTGQNIILESVRSLCDQYESLCHVEYTYRNVSLNFFTVFLRTPVFPACRNFGSFNISCMSLNCPGLQELLWSKRLWRGYMEKGDTDSSHARLRHLKSDLAWSTRRSGRGRPVWAIQFLKDEGPIPRNSDIKISPAEPKIMALGSSLSGNTQRNPQGESQPWGECIRTECPPPQGQSQLAFPLQIPSPKS